MKKSYLNLITDLLDLKTEKIMLLQSDKIIFEQVGNEFSVEIDTIHLPKFADTVIFHNHPKGENFSLTDVYNTISLNAKGMYLVTATFLYYFERPKGGWSVDLNDLEIILNKLDLWANSEIDILISKGVLNYNDATIEKNHYLWMSLFQYYGINYKRKPIKELFG